MAAEGVLELVAELNVVGMMVDFGKAVVEIFELLSGGASFCAAS